MPANHHTLDFQRRDSIRQRGEIGRVGRVQHVGDVAVGEDLAWVGVEQSGLGTAGVGTADPEEGGLLAFGAGGHDVGVGGAVGGGSLCVLGEEGGEGICCWWWRTQFLVFESRSGGGRERRGCCEVMVLEEGEGVRRN